MGTTGKLVYTSGVFDLLHVGHVRVIKAAASLGDRLIVGVTTDELAHERKGRWPVVPFEQRCELVSALRGVDAVIPQRTMDKVAIWERLRFDCWVVGDDWFDSPEAHGYRSQLEEHGVQTVFVPYTTGVSTTMRRQAFGVGSP